METLKIAGNCVWNILTRQVAWNTSDRGAQNDK